MSPDDITYVPELAAHDDAIDAINEDAFGPGRFAKAAYRIREGGPHERALSFVALRQGEVVASVRMTRIVAGQAPGQGRGQGRALLLGPLAVTPAYKNNGIGKKLVAMALDAARAAGHAVVILVGDQPYYGPLGFAKVAAGLITMPRPVDPARLLFAELKPGGLGKLQGEVMHEDISGARA